MRRGSFVGSRFKRAEGNPCPFFGRAGAAIHQDTCPSFRGAAFSLQGNVINAPSASAGADRSGLSPLATAVFSSYLSYRRIHLYKTRLSGFSLFPPRRFFGCGPFSLIGKEEQAIPPRSLKEGDPRRYEMNKQKRLIALILALAAGIMAFVPERMRAMDGVSAKSAILIEQHSGRVLFAKDAYTKRRIASITKIMTAILAIESGKMDDTVTVSARAVRTEGSSIYLRQGEKIKLRDLVYGLMLRSGNDAAVAIAEHVGGSVEGFVF